MILPLRATITTAPGSLPSAISFLSVVLMRARRSPDMPTCSGAALASGWRSRAPSGIDVVATTNVAARAAVAQNFHRDMTFPPRFIFREPCRLGCRYHNRDFAVSRRARCEYLMRQDGDAAH